MCPPMIAGEEEGHNGKNKYKGEIEEKGYLYSL